MDPKLLMDKRDQLSFEILSELNKSSNQPVDVNEIAANLGLSAYKLNSSLEYINNDLVELADTQNAHVIVISKGIWQSENLSNLIVQKIKLAYFNRSQLFPAFEHLMFYDEVLTPNQFLNQSYLSRAALYRNIKSAKSIIKKHLNLKEFGSAANLEFRYRLVLFQLYYNVYSGLEVPFPKLNDLINDLISDCEPYFDRPLRLSQEFKLSVFLRIWIMRHRNQKINTDSVVVIDKEDAKYPELFQKIKKTLGRKFALDHAEMGYLYGFLLAKQYIKQSNDHEINTNFPLASKLSDHFIDFIEKHHIIDAPMGPNLKDGLRADLLNVNLQLTSFYIEPTTFVRENSVKFFKKSYPSFDIVINRFLKTFEKNEGFTLDRSNQINLYYGYVFALINNIPAHSLTERVYIAVDFSQGDLYTDYVISSLDAFHHANIIIEEKVSANTDIYISDVFAQKLHLPQLTWEDPPTPSDWEDLGAMIESIRASKASALFKTYR